MVIQSPTQEMVKFLSKSFKPNYIIHLTNKNKIATFDECLINDFQTVIKTSEEYVGLDAIELIIKKNYHRSGEYR